MTVNPFSTLPQQEALPMTSTSPLEELFASGNVAGGASESTIAEAEATLGVRFPPSYRSFLAQFGAAVGRGFSIAGLFHHLDQSTPPLWENVVTWNLRNRRVTRGLIPARYIAISSDGGDYIFYLDTGTMDTESPVVVLGPGRDYVVVAPDFNTFVIDFSKASLLGERRH
jgi:SMI1/KNR4 family protein SUKH-1